MPLNRADPLEVVNSAPNRLVSITYQLSGGDLDGEIILLTLTQNKDTGVCVIKGFLSGNALAESVDWENELVSITDSVMDNALQKLGYTCDLTLLKKSNSI